MVEQIISMITVSNATACTIVLDFLADAISHYTQEQRLDQVATVLEIAQCLKIALALIGPFFLEVAYVWA